MHRGGLKGLIGMFYAENIDRNADLLMTNSGRLPCKKIIHYGQGSSSDFTDVTCRCLLKAEEHTLSSVSLPAFGTGQLLHNANI